MPMEIERKFLVVGDLWRQQVSRSEKMRDGLVATTDGRKVRVRLYDDRATITIKGARVGIGRDEFEYDISTADGLALLEDHCGGSVLDKTRHNIKFKGCDWTVDEYHGALSGTFLAEIELPSEDADFKRPTWIGEEVTGHQAYRKINLVKARRQK